MKKAFLTACVILFIFFVSQSLSWSAKPVHDSSSTNDTRFTAQDDQSGDFHEDFERQIESLLRNLEKLRKQAKDKMTREIVPYFREEIERIKRWLRDFRLQREQEDQPERIRT
jgi:peptidoglycan hydrolase CwlO-like protein